MKSRYFLLAIVISSIAFFASCSEDDPIIEVDPRDGFLGVWKVNEDCQRLNYDVNITYDPDNSVQVLIENFVNPGPGYDPVTALIVGDKIFVSQQVTGDNWTVSGEGNLVNNRIEWEYELIIGGNKLECTASYTR
jgi:hypothetical protein